MNPQILARITRKQIREQGWPSGTTLEDKVAWVLMKCELEHGRDVETQYRIQNYRADFAFPDSKVVLEADGWWHRSPEGAASDARRDSDMRSEGWLVFRVDDRHGTDNLEEQVRRVAAVVIGGVR